MLWCVGGVLGCNLDFVAGLFLEITRVCALPYMCAVYVFFQKLILQAYTENTAAVLVIT